MAPQGYESAIERVAFVERNDRALLALSGGDRASWLHNLVTNEVRNLGAGDGNYAFATNVKGRVLFDVNLFVRDEAIWLDLSREHAEAARTHLDRYLITEDVSINDVSDRTYRLGVLGPRAADWAARLGVHHLPAMAQLHHTDIVIDNAAVTLLRHDFAGLPGFELIVANGEPGERIRTAVLAAGESLEPAEVSFETIDTLRQEAGIPWIGREIDDSVLPAETGQVDRAVSYHKGCYLGQEVVERMRSRGSLARRLVGVRIEGAVVPPTEASFRTGNADVGRLTSACHSPAVGSVIGLGYLRSEHDSPGTAVQVVCGDETCAATVGELPFRRA